MTSPTPSAALIQGDTLVFESEGRRQEIPLSTNAVVGGFVAAFRYVLAGDRAALERTFELGHEALPGGRWRLTLRPRTEALRSFLTELKLEGSGQSVETMVMNRGQLRRDDDYVPRGPPRPAFQRSRASSSVSALTSGRRRGATKSHAAGARARLSPTPMAAVKPIARMAGLSAHREHIRTRAPCSRRP